MIGFPTDDVRVFWKAANDIVEQGGGATAGEVLLALVFMNGFREIADAIEDHEKSMKKIADSLETAL